MMKPNMFSLSPWRRAPGLERGQRHRIYQLSPNRSVRKFRLDDEGEGTGKPRPFAKVPSQEGSGSTCRAAFVPASLSMQAGFGLCTQPGPSCPGAKRLNYVGQCQPCSKMCSVFRVHVCHFCLEAKLLATFSPTSTEIKARKLSGG